MLGFSTFPSYAQDKVVLQLRWDHQAQFAGYYAALWQGFYADAGLNVEIRSAFTDDSRAQPVLEVTQGQADFGIGGADVVVAIAGGAPLLIATPVFQHSGLGILAPENARIFSPSDLSGLRVAIPISPVSNAELNAMLAAEGVDPNSINWVEVAPGKGPQSLADGLVDALFTVWPAAKWVLSDLGVEATFLGPTVYGVDFYGDAIFTTSRLAENDPELVQRFIAASFQGWEYALDHREEITDRISSELPRTIPIADIRAFNRSMLKEIADFSLPPEMTLGFSNPARWSAMFRVLAETELADGEFEYLDFVFDPERREAQARESFLTRLAIGLVVGIVLAITVLVLAWSWTLRRQVEARTRDLVDRDRELSESEAQYALVVAGSDAGIFEWNIGTGVVYRSPRFLSLIGYDEGDLPATPEGFFRIVHPDDRDRLKTSMNRHLKERTRHDVEVRILHKQGHYIWAQITGQAAWDEQGEPLSLAGSVIEITKRKVAETALRSSEERFALAVAGIDAGLWDWTHNTGESYRSPRWHEILGLSNETFPPTREAFFALIHPDDVQPFRDAIQGHIADLLPFDIIIRVRHANGHYIWVHERGQAVWDEAGNILRMVGSITDISKRKWAEEELRRYEVIVANSSDMIALMDRDYKYLAANQAYLRPFGKTKDQVVGFPVKSLLGDKLLHEKIKPNFEKLLSGDEVHYQEWITFPGGWRAHLDVSYSPYVGASGEILGMVIIARDISEHFEVAGKLDAATGRLASIIGQAGEAIITIDEHQDIQLFNQAAAELFGYTSDSATKLNLDDLIPELHCDAHRKHVAKFLGSTDNQRLMNVPGEISGLRKDGSKFPAEATISSFVSNGEKLGTVMIRDISDRVQWENRLRDASNEAQLANRAKTEFLANTSHELRTPMNAIIGFTELLMAGVPGDPTTRQLEYFKDIHGSSLHLLGVINDILDLSKIEADVVNLKESDIELPQAVESTIRILSERADRGGLTLLNQVPDALPWLRADARILKQILINLLSNAVKFTEPGGTITVGAHVIHDGCVEIWVSDTGIGMDKNDIAKAMTAFGQVDGALNRSFEGTGLGLPLVKSQLEAHGGMLIVASARGTGTTMTIRFPDYRSIVSPHTAAANA
ncbi:MAG: PAS domain S-box protein [Alphaproteobacteria bacterium]|nr:PAS domain S-box protein [Alphaproteobacteria bacterium]MBT5861149.1 PAS domain S-box protein [Alphaproteobacteria bacterium]